MLPAGDEVPGAQGAHAALLEAESAGFELPTGQGVAEALPAGQKLPAGHGVQALLPPGESMPAGQAWQLQASSWLPAEQLEGALLQPGSGLSIGWGAPVTGGGWGAPTTRAAIGGQASV